MCQEEALPPLGSIPMRLIAAADDTCKQGDKAWLNAHCR